MAPLVGSAANIATHGPSIGRSSQPHVIATRTIVYWTEFTSGRELQVGRTPQQRLRSALFLLRTTLDYGATGWVRRKNKRQLRNKDAA